MRRLIPTIAFALLLAAASSAQTWRPIGPEGGDVRSLAVDPRNSKVVYLGTTDGHVFGSQDGGQSWQVLGRAGHSHDGVITAIIVDLRDTRRLYASIWTLHSRSGGVFRSDDAGLTWQLAGLPGQQVRALAQASADPDTLIAGTLDGVYRSADSAVTWHRISPEGHEELRNFDSVAIDPRDPAIIYAGTYHLPWKTTDGGRTWSPIHAGMLDDSDVMSIWIDRTNPQRVYASACSGIYRSDNAGKLWQKIQGIPRTAQRTHVIQQHPTDANTVFAGTTEGLWRTRNAGGSWTRVTPRDWVINALAFVEDQLIVGTEHLGVLRASLAPSAAPQLSFQAANRGFHHRQITGFAIDPDYPDRVLAVLSNSAAGALATEDGGVTWSAVGAGLDNTKLSQLVATPSGWWATLANGGLLRYDAAKRAWRPAGVMLTTATPNPRQRARGPQPLRARVTDMAFAGDLWYAASSEGLLISRDAGSTWSRLPLGPLSLPLPVRSVRVSRDGTQLWLVSLRGLVFSRDSGQTWTWHDLPAAAGGALRLEVAADSCAGSSEPNCSSEVLLATAAVGLYVSRDGGRSWRLAGSGLPETAVQALAVSDDVVLAAMQSGGLYISRDAARTWTRVEGHLADGFFPAVLPGRSSLVFAASASDGVFAVDLTAPRASATSGGGIIKE